MLVGNDIYPYTLVYMYTIVGLGNPGKEYEETRHNAGRLVLTLLAQQFDFSQWKKDMKSQSQIATGTIAGMKARFVLPDTFMNNSGISLKSFVKTTKDLEQLIVLYDELNIGIGTIKISYDRSAGGHNGVASIIKQLHSQAFTRIRVGVTPVASTGELRRPTGALAKDFVLKKFRDNELKEIKKVTKQIGQALELFVIKGRSETMTHFN